MFSSPHPPPSAWRATIAAFCASLVGIGLARFAYTPLLPAIVAAHWFAASSAAYLGAANLAGYLLGALLGRPAAIRTSPRVVLRASMALATVAFAACAYPVSLSWFFGWRLLSGVAGGASMVLAAPAVLPLVPAARRGVVGGIVFMGVGVGVAASGTLVPLLLAQSLAATWWGLAALSAVLTLVAWNGWPRGAPPPAAQPAARTHDAPSRPLRALYLQYALNAAGWVPHMIFLVDFVARGLGRGIDTATRYWVIFGIGATVGPVLAGALADRTGFRRALRIAFVVDAGAIALPAVSTATLSLIVSSALVGAFVTGTVPLVLGRLHDLLAHRPDRQGDAWKTATVVFALFQAMAAYAMSYGFSASGGHYRGLFIVGAVALVVALAIDSIGPRRGTHRQRG